MTIADRIQHLRKSKGISQEELADRIGVSRQAVSKWESEQSMPDLDKIILMSDYFEVSTDYILKGIEPNQNSDCNKVNAMIFTMISIANNLIGLLLAIVIWKERHNAISTAIGLIFMIFGTLIFGIGVTLSADNTKQRAKKLFGIINTWIYGLITLSLIYNSFFEISWGYLRFAPLPQLHYSIRGFMFFWILYFIICTVGDLIIYRHYHK